MGKWNPLNAHLGGLPGGGRVGGVFAWSGAGLDPPAPLKTPEYQWWGRIENKFICKFLPDK